MAGKKYSALMIMILLITVVVWFPGCKKDKDAIAIVRIKVWGLNTPQGSGKKGMKKKPAGKPKLPAGHYYCPEYDFPRGFHVTEAVIDGLSAVTGTAPGTVDLTWTAVGDDGNTGWAQGYQVKFSESPIDDTNFGSLVSYCPPGFGGPQAPGSTENCTIMNLLPGVTYYFAVKTNDDVFNLSPISNVVSAVTAPNESIPPAAITDLSAVTGPDPGTVFLTWTAVGDDGNTGGNATWYEIKASESPIDDTNFDSATPCPGGYIPWPGSPGSTDNLMVNDLLPGVTYYFAIKTHDDVGNTSPISNVVSAASGQ